MSLKIRALWVLPVLLAGSWLAVRSLAASPASAAELDDPPLMLERPAPELRDPALARFLGEQAATARARRR